MAFVELRRKSCVSFFMLTSFVQMGVNTVSSFKILQTRWQHFLPALTVKICVNRERKEKSKLVCFYCLSLSLSNKLRYTNESEYSFQ